MKNFAIFYFILVGGALNAQLVINEGSNKNFNSILDEDDESEDWIEQLQNIIVVPYQVHK